MGTLKTYAILFLSTLVIGICVFYIAIVIVSIVVSLLFNVEFHP